jgi:methionyl-tRNA synthetase
MIAKNCAASVPDWREGGAREEDLALLARADSLLATSRGFMKSYQPHNYLAAVFEVVAEANRYFANAEPWKLAKSEPARMRVVLFTTIEVLRTAGVLLQPVMPASMGKLLDLLGVAPDARDFVTLEAGEGAGRIEAPHRLKIGAPLPPPSPVFPRYVEPAAVTP